METYDEGDKVQLLHGFLYVVLSFKNLGSLVKAVPRKTYDMCYTFIDTRFKAFIRVSLKIGVFVLI